MTTKPSHPPLANRSGATWADFNTSLHTNTEDVVQLLTDDGQPCGTLPRNTVHTSSTPLHRAFSVYLFDRQGNVLTTRRALNKVAWPGVWTNSCCGHPRPDETDQQAITRRVQEELGVTIHSLQPALPDFRYRAVDASGIVENEICPVYTAIVDHLSLHPDPDEVMGHAWVPWPNIVRAIDATPHIYSPWSAMQVPQLADVITHTPPYLVEDSRMTPHLPHPFDGLPDSETLVQKFLGEVDTFMADESSWLIDQWNATGLNASRIIGHGDLPTWLRELSVGKGKRIRPQMVLWGYLAGDGRHRQGWDAVIRVAAALETLHIFGLIHDDVMDESDTRRGEPAVHIHARRYHIDHDRYGCSQRFGESIAILLGDLAHTQADRIIGQLDQRFHDVWYELCAELIAGQSADLLGAAGADLTPDMAWRIAQLKSGSYTITRPLLMGALAAGADMHTQSALTRYGRLVGEVFALRDDVLGVWGDPEKTGKPSGDDLAARKPTTLWARAEQELTGVAADALRRVGTTLAQPDDVHVVANAMVACGLREESEKAIKTKVDQAISVIHGAKLPDHAVEGLSSIATRIAWRDR